MKQNTRRLNGVLYALDFASFPGDRRTVDFLNKVRGVDVFVSLHTDAKDELLRRVHAMLGHHGGPVS